MTSAQVPTPQYTFTLEWAHPEVTVPDTGRTDVDLIVKMVARDFVCAPPGPCKVSVELKLDSFAKWAGSSLEPFTATFTLPANEPGVGERSYAPDEDIKLNLAWDVETAPKTGAKQVYVAQTANAKIEGATVPQVQPRNGKSAPLTATLPDRPVEVNATAAIDCQSDPFNPACANMATTAPAESPAIDTGILLASLAVFALVFRRRRA